MNTKLLKGSNFRKFFHFIKNKHTTIIKNTPKIDNE